MSLQPSEHGGRIHPQDSTGLSVTSEVPQPLDSAIPRDHLCCAEIHFLFAKESAHCLASRYDWQAAVF